jgi:pilus assembly protein CpaE
LAVVLASKSGTCGLIDMRLCNGDLASLLDLEPKYGLAELCSNLLRLDRSMLQQFFTDHASGVRLLSAPHTMGGVEAVTPHGVRQALAMARSEFRHVVIDLDNVVSDEQQEAIWQSELLLLVVRPDYTSLRNVRRTLDHLRSLGVAADKVRVIANRIGERGQLSMAQLEEGLGQSVMVKLPDEPARVNAAVNAGVPIVLQCPRARVSRQIAALAEALSRAIDKAR